MEGAYLLLAVVGALVPYGFFLNAFSEAGLDLLSFVASAVANPVASGFTADLLIASVVFWLFMVNAWRRGRGPTPALFLVLNLLVGLSCALPAYLHARARRGNGVGA